jgi:hypothetical protein
MPICVLLHVADIIDLIFNVICIIITYKLLICISWGVRYLDSSTTIDHVYLHRPLLFSILLLWIVNNVYCQFHEQRHFRDKPYKRKNVFI